MPPRSSKRVLDPVERVSEVLFGLVMVLTFTGALSVVEAGRDDIRVMLIGALGVFLLVFLSTFPVVNPFLVMQSAVPALRVSNGIAIVMLLVAGHVYGRVVGRNPWLLGLSMVLLGVLLAGLAMALGG